MLWSDRKKKKKRQGLNQIKDDLFVKFFYSGGSRGSKELNVFVFAMKNNENGRRKKIQRKNTLNKIPETKLMVFLEG